jgi:hypothetical protein
MRADRNIKWFEVGIPKGIVGQTMCPDLGVATTDDGPIIDRASSVNRQ